MKSNFEIFSDEIESLTEHSKIDGDLQNEYESFEFLSHRID